MAEKFHWDELNSAGVPKKGTQILYTLYTLSRSGI